MRSTRGACQAFKAAKLREAAELRQAIAAGAVIRDHRGRRTQPLGPSSIHKLISCLASILDEAVEDELIDRNPARGRRMRIKVPKPARTFLELDELVALTDAAGDQDAPITRVPRQDAYGQRPPPPSWPKLIAQGMRPSQIATHLGLAKSTVTYHASRLGVHGRGDYVGRRAVVATLGGAGLRASELCDVRLRDLRVHDAAGSRLGSSTPRPRRASAKCKSAPTSQEELVAHIDRLRRARQAIDPDAFLFPNTRGGRMNRQRVAEIVRDAAKLASQPARRARTSAAAQHDASQPPAHLRIDCASGKQLRRHMGDEPSRARRLEDDNRRVCAAPAARPARARASV